MFLADTDMVDQRVFYPAFQSVIFPPETIFNLCRNQASSYQTNAKYAVNVVAICDFILLFFHKSAKPKKANCSQKNLQKNVYLDIVLHWSRVFFFCKFRLKYYTHCEITPRLLPVCQNVHVFSWCGLFPCHKLLILVSVYFIFFKLSWPKPKKVVLKSKILKIDLWIFIVKHFLFWHSAPCLSKCSIFLFLLWVFYYGTLTFKSCSCLFVREVGNCVPPLPSPAK